MRTSAGNSLIPWLLEQQFLTAAQSAELRTLPMPPDSGTLLKSLVQRGWLTGYQADQILAGKGAELVLGHYRLASLLGEGSTGKVFKAIHLPTGRRVALKVIHRERVADRRGVERFKREIQAATQLAHPNIVAALEAAVVDQRLYLAMELIEGVDLNRLIKKKGPLPIAAACDVARQAALALQHAHERGVVHRDVKPSNLLIARDDTGQPGHVKILDFGLARFVSESDQAGRLTQVGSIVGTVDYMAPEQAEDPRTADVRADIYSLGCTLYFLLAGRVPFAGQSAVERLTARMMGQPPRLRLAQPEAPAALETVLLNMMARAPAQRYQTPAAVAAALTPFAHGLADPECVAIANNVPPEPDPSIWNLGDRSGSADTALSRSWNARGAKAAPRSRKPLWLAGGAVAALAALVAGWVILHQGSAVDEPPDGNPPGKTADFVPAGYFAFSHVVSGAEQAAPPLAFQPDHTVIENGRPIGAWESKGNELLVTCTDKRDGHIRLRQETPLLLSGKQVFQDKTEQSCRLRKLNGEWAPLVTGKDLAGWQAAAGSTWRIENDLLIHDAGAIPLVTSHAGYESFHLRFQARLQAGGRHAVVVRANTSPANRPEGYGILLSGDKADKCGSLFEVTTRSDNAHALGPVLQTSEGRVPRDTWFSQEIVADGNHITIKINDRIVVDYHDPDARCTRGAIAVLPLAGGNTRIEFKNVEIKELTPWIALFDGRNLGGWSERPGSPHFWKIRDGLLVGECSKGYDHLFSAGAHWADFHLVMEAKVSGGDKGSATGALGFRAKVGPGRLPDGYLVNVNLWSKLTTGTLFRNREQERNQDPLVAVDKTQHGDDSWFMLEVIAHGPLLEVVCKDKKTVSHWEREPYVRGHIVLSVMENHVRADAEPVVFTVRRLAIRELPAPAP